MLKMSKPMLFVFLLLILVITSQFECKQQLESEIDSSPSIVQKQRRISEREEAVKEKENGGLEMFPTMNEVIVETMMGRRKLGRFQICALCTCCGGAKGYCMPSPCCYSINCNIPNRPFGFCAFTPKTCNCLGCHL